MVFRGAYEEGQKGASSALKYVVIIITFSFYILNDSAAIEY